MANDTQDPNFSSEQAGALDYVARQMLDDDQVTIEVIEGDADEPADAIADDGSAWHVEETVIRIKRCKPRE